MLNRLVYIILRYCRAIPHNCFNRRAVSMLWLKNYIISEAFWIIHHDETGKLRADESQILYLIAYILVIGQWMSSRSLHKASVTNRVHILSTHSSANQLYFQLIHSIQMKMLQLSVKPWKASALTKSPSLKCWRVVASCKDWKSPLLSRRECMSIKWSFIDQLNVCFMH